MTTSEEKQLAEDIKAAMEKYAKAINYQSRPSIKAYWLDASSVDGPYFVPRIHLSLTQEYTA